MPEDYAETRAELRENSTAGKKKKEDTITGNAHILKCMAASKTISKKTRGRAHHQLKPK